MTWSRTRATSTAGRCSSVGWLVCYIAWGAAALHPSMTGLTRPAGSGELSAGTPRPASRSSWSASLIPPVFLFVACLARTRRRRGLVVAIACGVLYLLMLTRLWDVAASHRRSLVRERTLRVASAALASAGSAEEVARAVRDAAATLVPGTPAERAAMLAVRDGDRLRRVRRAVCAGRRCSGDPVELWRRLAASRCRGSSSLEEIQAARTGRRGCRVPALPGPDARLRRRACSARSPSRTGRTATRSSACSSFYGDRQGARRPLARALEILAGQAALAVERVVLNQEVVRQRGEALFRTLVQDTSDVILILGDDRQDQVRHPVRGGHLRRRRRRGHPAGEPGGAGHARGRRPGDRPDAHPQRRRAVTGVPAADRAARRPRPRCSRSAGATCAATRPSAAWCSPCAT